MQTERERSRNIIRKQKVRDPVVHKRRKHGRVVEVTPHVVYGTLVL